jgi:phage shock protein E
MYMKPQAQQSKRRFIAIGVVILAVVGGLWLFDTQFAQGKEVPSDALVVDVRTPGEYAGGHYDGSINIPVSRIGVNLARFGAKSRKIIVYCRSGSRSHVAKRILEQAGFTDVEDGGSFSSMRRRKRAQRSTPPQSTTPPQSNATQ